MINSTKRDTTQRKVAKRKPVTDEGLSTRHIEKFKIQLTKPQKEIVNFLKQDKI